MRKLAIAVALASTAISTPVVARDHSPYIGVDVGPMIVEHFQYMETSHVPHVLFFRAVKRFHAEAREQQYGIPGTGRMGR